MEFQEVVGRRRMVRGFEARAVPGEVVERLLTNARRGPSAGFSQGVDLLVLEGPEQTARYWDATLERERAGFPWPALFDAPLLIVFLADEQAYRDRYAESDKNMPPDASWPVPYWHVDAGFAALLALLTAVDAGLGALFFSVHAVDRFRAAFGVPDQLEPTGVVAVGYPRPDADRPSPSLARGHRPPERVIHRGRW